MTNEIAGYQVRWYQQNGECGEDACSKTFVDRENAFYFSATLDPQVCTAIRVYTLTEATPPTPRKPKNAPRRWVALCLTAERQPNGRQGYKVLRAGDDLATLKAEADRDEVGTFYVTESVARRSYKRAWRQWEEAQEAEAAKADYLADMQRRADEHWTTHDRNKYDYLDLEPQVMTTVGISFSGKSPEVDWEKRLATAEDETRAHLNP